MPVTVCNRCGGSVKALPPSSQGFLGWVCTKCDACGLFPSVPPETHERLSVGPKTPKRPDILTDTEKPLSGQGKAVYLPLTGAAQSPLEERFLAIWGSIGPISPVLQYKFAAPGRRYQFDFAWPEERVAVECEGYDHRKEQGFHRDIEKYNLAVKLGWRVLRVTARMLGADPQGFCDLVQEVLHGGK